MANKHFGVLLINKIKPPFYLKNHCFRQPEKKLLSLQPLLVAGFVLWQSPDLICVIAIYPFKVRSS
ncbi:MAG: hypothetical protein IJR44_01855 [Neisseriaceae bacterium]|nr:hypothetical protein [Neisseriaceae bacterium]